MAGAYLGSTAWYRRMLVVDDPKQRLHGLQFVIRRLPLNQLDDRTPDAPDIRGCRRARELNDLRRHPIRRSYHTRLIQPRLLCSHTEVGQLYQPLLGCQDVGALDVAVDDTLLVQVQQAVEDLGHVEGDEVFRKLAEVLADAVQRPVLAVPAKLAPILPSIPVCMAMHLLQDYVQTLGALDEAVVLDDVGMVEVLEQVDLQHDGLEVGRAQVLQPDLLDGYRLAGAPVQGAVHAAKGALAQTVAQLVVFEADDILRCPLCRPLPARSVLTARRACVRNGRGRCLLCVAGRVGARGLLVLRARLRVCSFWGVRDHLSSSP